MSKPLSASVASGDSDRLMAEVVAEITDRLQAGRPVDVAEYLARYPALADRLRPMLEALDLLAQFSSSAGSDRSSGKPVAGEPLGGTLGDFRIVREVGRGGMGVVYEAEQISLRRRVALKVLPFAATMDPRHLQRFHNEAQAAACLHHTNIVPVFFVGCERGVHFYAMQFIEGQPLSDIIRQLQQAEKKAPTPRGEATVAYQPSGVETASTPLPSAEMTPLTAEGRRSRDYYCKVAELGVQAAEALDHAHQLGIVHRDIKPANLLLDGRGSLWVTDFGLAHMQHGEANLTMTGQALGTPRYMSPEQTMAKRVPIDHRTDVYSLGVTLYELLTLRSAFASEDRQELLRQIAAEEPARPRRWDRAIPEELEIIVLKAMEKRPQDRYATAQDMADDLERWLKHEPIRARKPTVPQRVGKWARRHHTFVRMFLLMLVMAVAGLAATVLVIGAAYEEEATQRKLAQDAQKKESQQRAIAEDERDLAERNLYIARMHLAKQAWDANDIVQLRELLENLKPLPGRHDLRGWEWSYFSRLADSKLFALEEPGRYISRAFWSPDGKRLAGLSNEGSKYEEASTALDKPKLPMTVTIWDIGTKTVVARLSGHPTRINWLEWSPDGRCLATASDDKTAKVWDSDTGAVVHTLQHDDEVQWVFWSPDGRRIGTSTREWASWTGKKKSQVAVWEASTGRKIFQRQGSTLFQMFNRDGTQLWVAKEPDPATGAVRFWLYDVATGKEAATITPPSDPVNHAVFSPDGKRLLLGPRRNEFAKMLDPATGRAILTFEKPQAKHGIPWEWTPDGKRVRTNDRDVVVWDAATGRVLLSFSTGEGWDCGCSGDGQQLLTSALNGTMSIWSLATGKKTLTLHRPPFTNHRLDLQSPYWSPDGQHLCLAQAGHLEVWDATAEQEQLTLPLPGQAIPYVSPVWSPDGALLATGDLQVVSRPSWERNGDLSAPLSSARLWDANTGRQILALPLGRAFPRALAWSPDGKSLAVLLWVLPRDRKQLKGARFGTIQMWDVTTGQIKATWDAHALGWLLDWSPDGKQLASQGAECLLNGQPTGILSCSGSQPKGQAHIMNLGPLGFIFLKKEAQTVPSIKIWDADTGREVHSKLVGENPRSLAWSPDGKHLAFAGNPVKVWDTSTWEEVFTHGGDAKQAIGALAWNPDGSQLALATERIEIWDLNAAKVRLRLRGHTQRITSIAWHPQDQRLVSVGGDQRIKIWDTIIGEEMVTLPRPAGEVPESISSLIWSPDGRRMAANTASGIKLWDTSRESIWQPSFAAAQDKLAWAWANSKDATLRDPVRAVEAARKAVALAPANGAYWCTLGVCQYRAADFKAAQEALEKSVQLRSGGDSTVWFFLAMAHWQLHETEKARAWYDQAVAWMNENLPQDEELKRFRAEASALLGIKETSTTKGKEVLPKKE